MARLVGIEVSLTHVRAVAVSASYRRVTLERMVEIDLRQVKGLDEAVRQAASALTTHGESVAITVDGVGSYLQQIELPGTAMRQLEQVVPFELEARVPVDIDDLVFDYDCNSATGDWP